VWVWALVRLLRWSLPQRSLPAVEIENDQRRPGRSPGDRSPVARRTCVSLRVTHSVVGALHGPRRPTVARFVVCRAKSVGAPVMTRSAPLRAFVRHCVTRGFIDTFTRGVIALGLCALYRLRRSDLQMLLGRTTQRRRCACTFSTSPRAIKLVNIDEPP
jgi:hypothetical protein